MPTTICNPDPANGFRTKSGLLAVYVDNYAGLRYFQVYDLPFETEKRILPHSKKKKGGYYSVSDDNALWKERYTQDGYLDSEMILPPHTSVEDMAACVAENN